MAKGQENPQIMIQKALLCVDSRSVFIYYLLLFIIYLLFKDYKLFIRVFQDVQRLQWLYATAVALFMHGPQDTI
jgi:hypothetical protein